MDMPHAATWNRTYITALIVAALGAAMLGNLQAQKPAALQQQAAPTAKPGSLVAIADLHGDIDKAKSALQLLSIVDDQGRWSAEGVTVVQLGDLVDRGPSSLQLLSYMHSLQDQAVRHSSRLVLLLGNHELLNLHGDFRYVAADELTQLGQRQSAEGVAAGSQASLAAAATADSAETAATAVAADPAATSQHDAATAAYLAGLEAWAALWRKPAGSQKPPSTAAAAAAAAAGPPSGVAAGDARSSVGHITAAEAAAAEGAEGSVRAAVVERHQLLAVHGRGGPCATAFVHAGLITQALDKLLLISSSSSSSGDGTPPETLDTTPAHNSVHHRMHDRHLGVLGSSSSSSSRTSQVATDKEAAAALPVAVVSVDELQGINSLVWQALQDCDSRSCPDGSPLLHHVMAVLASGQGPLWTRHQAQGRQASVCSHLEQVLARLGVRRLVVGHTPQASGRAAARCAGRLLLLDTGMSSGMNGSPAAAWLCHAGVAQHPLDLEAECAGSGSGTGNSEDRAGNGRAAGSKKCPGGSNSSSGNLDSRSVLDMNYSVVAYADGIVAGV